MKQVWWGLMTVGLILLFGGYLMNYDFGSFGAGIQLNEVEAPADAPETKSFNDIENEFNSPGLAPFVVLNSPTGNSNVHEVVMVVRKFKFNPDVISVRKGDTVRLKIASADYNTGHSFVLEGYDIYEQIPAGSGRDDLSIIEFKADKLGTFAFSCSGYGHSETGKLVVIN